MDFATNFKRICKEKGTSPTRVCLEIGLSSSKVNLWNKGSIPKGDVMIKLAEKLGCNVMDFFADEESLTTVEGSPAHNADSVLDDDEKDIIRIFRMLDRKQRHGFMTKAYAFEATLIESNTMEEQE